MGEEGTEYQVLVPPPVCRLLVPIQTTTGSLPLVDHVAPLLSALANRGCVVQRRSLVHWSTARDSIDDKPPPSDAPDIASTCCWVCQALRNPDERERFRCLREQHKPLWQALMVWGGILLEEHTKRCLNTISEGPNHQRTFHAQLNLGCSVVRTGPPTGGPVRRSTGCGSGRRQRDAQERSLDHFLNLHGLGAKVRTEVE